MCIIAASPQGVIIPKENLEQCFKNNSDGAGFMYHDNGLVVEKGFFSFDEFYEAYAPHAEKKIVCHFRIKTHGEKNKDNCHPFLVSEDMAFVHNGIIKIEEDHKEYSDTWHFNEKIIKPMYRDNRAFIRRLYNRELIKGFIGYSKLVFMDSKGRSFIINSNKGEWHEGVWYSNTSYKVWKQLPMPTQVPQHQDYFSSSVVEGETVEFRNHYGYFRRGDTAYVENVYADGKVEVIQHRLMGNGKYEEIMAIVPKYILKSLEEYNV